MSRKFKFIVLSAISVMAAFSCTKQVVVSGEGDAIVVSAGVVTRAGYSGTEVIPEEFVMDILQNADPRYDYTAVHMKKADGGNIYTPKSGESMVWAGNIYDNVQVKAMTLPYGMETINADEVMSVAVSTDQTTEAEVLGSDLLAATTDASDITISDGVVKIEFGHLFSKLEVKYVVGSGLTPSDVTINSAVLENACIKGGYSYQTMSFDNSIDNEMGSISMYHDASDNLLEAIIVPYVPATYPRLVVNATISGKETVLVCSVVPNDANGFITGKRYKLNATITSGSISMNSVGISAGWDTDTDEKNFDTI